MTRFWAIVVIAVCVLGTVATASCVHGPSFTPVTAVPPGQAVVYIYRPKSALGGAVSYFVEANNARVVKLKNGGYYPYFTAPGTVVFSAKTEALSQAAIDVVAGNAYYLKGEIKMGAFVGRPTLQEVHPAIAVNEIAYCRPLPGL